MWKKVLLLPIFFIVLLLLAFLFSWQLKFLDLPLRIALEKATKDQVTFERVDFRLFNRLIIKNLTIGKTFRTEAITVYLAPLHLVSDIKHPEKAVRGVHFYKPSLIISNDFWTGVNQLNTKEGNPLKALTVSWEKGRIFEKDMFLNDCSGRLVLNDTISGRMSGRLFDGQLSFSFSAQQVRNGVQGEINCLFADKMSRYEIGLHGTRHEDGSFAAEVNAPIIRWGDFTLSNSTGSFDYAAAGFRAVLNNPNGRLELNGSDLNHLLLEAQLTLSSLVKGAEGKLSLTAEKDDRLVKGALTAENVTMDNMNFGNLGFSFEQLADGTFAGKGKIIPADYTITALLKNPGDIALRFEAGGNSSGTVLMRLKPLAVEMQFSRWPVDRLPGISELYPQLSGTMDFQGQITDDESRIELTGLNWGLPGSKPLSHSTRFIRKGDYCFLQSESLEKDWRFSGKWLARDNWDIKGHFARMSLEYLPKEFLADLPLSGTINGDFRYSSERNGAARIRLQEARIGDILSGDAKINVRITPEHVELRDVSVHSGKGTIAVHGNVGLKHKGDTQIRAMFHQFPLNRATLHGLLLLKGNLTPGREWGFSGDLESTHFSIGSWVSEKVGGHVFLTSSQCAITDFVFDPFIQGKLSAKFTNKALFGRFSLADIEVNKILPALKGRARGSLHVSGTVDSPVLVFNASATRLNYQKLNVTQTGAIIYRDRSVFLDKMCLSSGDDSLEISGKLWPELFLVGTVHSVSFRQLQHFGDFSLPLDGSLIGQMKATGTIKEPNIVWELSGNSLLYQGTPIDECGLQLTTTLTRAEVGYLTAKFSDSELRLLPGSSVDIAHRRFDINSEWRNIHIGSTDIFGGVRLSGTWKSSPAQKITIEGLLTAENAWVNQFSLEKSKLGFRYCEGRIDFLPQESQPLQVVGEIDCRSPSELNFRKFSVRWNNKSELAFNGTIGMNRWEFMLSGKAVSASALSDILGLPVTVGGELDTSIVGRGSLERPQLEGSVNVSNGTIENIPFDNINLQFSVLQNVMTIMRGKMVKNERYSVIAAGYIPFYLTETSRRRVMNDPLDVTITIEEGTLDLLTGLSTDIKSASGPLRAQLHLTGAMARPVANGYLKISNGEIISKRYVSQLNSLDIDCLWKDNLLSIRQFSGKAGEGRLQLKGSIAFDGLSPKEYNLHLQTDGERGVPITVPELPIPSPLFKSEDLQFLSNLSYGQPTFSLRLTGPAVSPLLSGWIEIENAHFTYPPRVKKSETESILDDVWPRLSWDLELRTGRKTWYDNELVSVNIQGGIKLTGKGAAPHVNGRIEAVRGNISYLGTEFRIKQAIIEIVKDEVFLEGNAETEVYGATPNDTDTIELILDKSEISRIQPRFLSKNNPALAPEKALAKATGIDPAMYSSTDREYLLRQQLIRLFDSTLTTPLARNLLRRSGIADTFYVRYLSQEPLKPANPANPTLSELLYGTKYSLEKHLGDRVLFGYSITFDQIQNKLDLRHELQVSYRWTKNVFVKGVYELETRNPLRQSDRRITLEQQWRFGWPKNKTNTNKTSK